MTGVYPRKDVIIPVQQGSLLVAQVMISDVETIIVEITRAFPVMATQKVILKAINHVRIQNSNFNLDVIRRNI